MKSFLLIVFILPVKPSLITSSTFNFSILSIIAFFSSLEYSSSSFSSFIGFSFIGFTFFIFFSFTIAGGFTPKFSFIFSTAFTSAFSSAFFIFSITLTALSSLGIIFFVCCFFTFSFTSFTFIFKSSIILESSLFTSSYFASLILIFPWSVICKCFSICGINCSFESFEYLAIFTCKLYLEQILRNIFKSKS